MLRRILARPFVSRPLFFRLSATMPSPERPHRVRALPKDTSDQKYLELVAEAASCLRNGKVIAVPTDTIYGLASLAQSVKGVKHIYEIKGRDFSKPVAICVSAVDDIEKYGEVNTPPGLLESLLPGPVTVMFTRKDTLNKALNPTAACVGVRVPDSDFILDVIRASGGEPLALTSANRSAGLSPLSITDFSELWEDIDLVCDGVAIADDEACRAGSTVVDLSTPGVYRVVREGSALHDTTRKLHAHGLRGDIAFKAVLLDIEGTTTPIEFVKEKLFPYIRANVAAYLERNWDEPETKDDVQALHRLAKEEGADYVTSCASDEDKNAIREALLRFVNSLMDADRKVTALKQLQGHMWRDAYARGAVVGELFADVYPALQAWTDEAMPVYIYSSGSVEAQQLLFAHTEHGDLLPMLKGHYDTNIGPKTEPSSYTAIAADLSLAPQDILFVSDSIHEVRAALGAGLHARLSHRPGNASIDHAQLRNIIGMSSFAELPRPARGLKRALDEEDAAPSSARKSVVLSKE